MGSIRSGPVYTTCNLCQNSVEWECTRRKKKGRIRKRLDVSSEGMLPYHVCHSLIMRNDLACYWLDLLLNLKYIQTY